jgi:CheY-like chemotaxis protein
MQELYLHDLSKQMLQGNGNGCGIPVTHFPFTIGRQRDCDFRLDNPFVSRHHCVLFLQDGQVWVQDMASYNGTFINDEPVKNPRPLRDGETLRVAYVPFRIALPAHVDASPVGAADELKAMQLTREPRRVLVVEDNADAAETLALILKAWGHEVRVAHDGPEALAAARADRPDTVLLDIRLPGMDGYQVAQQLRREPGLDKAQLVGITGYEQEKDRPQSREAGLDRVLIKPVAPEALQEVLAGAS